MGVGLNSELFSDPPRGPDGLSGIGIGIGIGFDTAGGSDADPDTTSDEG